MKNLLHIYAFGSICRGDVAPDSDIDLLAITSGGSNELSRSMFSIYSHSKIEKIWNEGNPFAWHLHQESKLLHSSNSSDFIFDLGGPASYSKAREDCERFLEIFRQALNSLRTDNSSVVFDLSAAFLGLRNFSTCFLLGIGRYDFSRGVALNLMSSLSASDLTAYRIMERARLLCTRGYGDSLTALEEKRTISALPRFEDRMIGFLE